MEALRECCKSLEKEAKSLRIGTTSLTDILHFIHGTVVDKEYQSLARHYSEEREELFSKIYDLEKRKLLTGDERAQLEKLKEKYEATDFKIRVINDTNRVKRFHKVLQEVA